MIETEAAWSLLTEKIKTDFNYERKPDLNAVLLLIGVQELGNIKKEFTKEEKQDLMHIAVCRLLSGEGYYEFDFTDEDGWPHWRGLKPLEKMTMDEQENLLKKNIITYFEKIFEE